MSTSSHVKNNFLNFLLNSEPNSKKRQRKTNIKYTAFRLIREKKNYHKEILQRKVLLKKHSFARGTLNV